jgi:excisionase family DNA binding protein
MAANNVMIEIAETRGRDPESWRAESLCRKHPTRWWFGGDQRETVLAKRMCAGCAVNAQCLEFALLRPELLGVWAATTPAERAAMRRTGGAPVEAPVEAAVEAPAQLEPDNEDADNGDVAAENEKNVDIDLVLEGEREREHEARQCVRIDAMPARATVLADSDALLTPAEAARRLGVTANTVTRWSRAGKIDAIYTVGGHRRFRGAEVERVLLAANGIAPFTSR